MPPCLCRSFVGEDHTEEPFALREDHLRGRADTDVSELLPFEVLNSLKDHPKFRVRDVRTAVVFFEGCDGALGYRDELGFFCDNGLNRRAGRSAHDDFQFHALLLEDGCIDACVGPQEPVFVAWKSQGNLDSFSLRSCDYVDVQ
jgi:hypothetical protein